MSASERKRLLALEEVGMTLDRRRKSLGRSLRKSHYNLRLGAGKDWSTFTYCMMMQENLEKSMKTLKKKKH